MMLTQIQTKVLGGALAGSLILSGVLGAALAWSRSELSSAKEVIRDLSSWQDSVIGSIELATGTSELNPDAAQLQLQALGNAYAGLSHSVEIQTQAIREMEAKTAAAQEAQHKEALARALAVAQAQNLRDRLTVMAETTVPAEEVDARVRKLQDELYEAGL